MIELFEKIIKFEEGYRLKVYNCTEGFKTVGIGHNLDADPCLNILKRTLKVGDKITEQESRDLFVYDMGKVFKQLDKRLPSWKSFEPCYQVVLVNMVFQLGIEGTMKFKNTIYAMQSNNKDRVIAGINNSLWVQQTPARCRRLIMFIKGLKVKEYE